MGDRGFHDLLDTKDLLYNSLSSDVLFDATAGGVTTGGGSNMVDMLDVPGTYYITGVPTSFRHFRKRGKSTSILTDGQCGGFINFEARTPIFGE